MTPYTNIHILCKTVTFDYLMLGFTYILKRGEDDGGKRQ